MTIEDQMHAILSAGVSLSRGEAIESLMSLADNSTNLVVTDPPYNLGEFMKGRQTNLAAMRANNFVAAGWDNGGADEWSGLMLDFFKQCSRILLPGGAVVVFMAAIKVETLIRVAQEAGLYYKTTGIWHKKNPMPRNMNLHFVNSTESWVYFVSGAKRGTFNNEGCVVHDFISTGTTPASEKRHGKHPTQKPVALMKHFVGLLSNPGELVVDPFMGSGTTGVAAVAMNRRFWGVDLDPSYLDISTKRIVDVQPTTAG